MLFTIFISHWCGTGADPTGLYMEVIWFSIVFYLLIIYISQNIYIVSLKKKHIFSMNKIQHFFLLFFFYIHGRKFEL